MSRVSSGGTEGGRVHPENEVEGGERGAPSRSPRRTWGDRTDGERG